MSNTLSQLFNRRLPPLSQVNQNYADHGSRTEVHAEVEPAMLITDGLVKNFFQEHSETLETLATNQLDRKRLRDIIYKKKCKQDKNTRNAHSAGIENQGNLPPNQGVDLPKLQDLYLNGDMEDLQNSMLDILAEGNILPLIYESANSIAIATSCDEFIVYRMNSSNKLCSYVPGTPHRQTMWPIGPGNIIAAYVASTLTALNVDDVMADDRFPKGRGLLGNTNRSVICVPLLHPSGSLMTVMEFARKWDNASFSEDDFQIAKVVTGWMGLAIAEQTKCMSWNTQSSINDILNITESAESNDAALNEICALTRRVVQAEMCVIYEVNQKDRQLLLNCIDFSDAAMQIPAAEKLKSSNKLPLDTGIIGQVVFKGEKQNIKNAYCDPRFNRELDWASEHTTDNVLCIPIMHREEVVGVLQACNKGPEIYANGFTALDEDLMNMACTYCTMALQCKIMSNELTKRKAEVEICQGTLAHYMQCSHREMKRLVAKPLPSAEEMPLNLNSLVFYGPARHERIMPEMCIQMVQNLGGPDLIPIKPLCAIILTGKKCYRNNPFHNWDHAFNVAHKMYASIIKLQSRLPDVFTPLRSVSLFIAALFHDIDHRGFDNAFVSKMNDPMAILYPYSTLEHHHYQTTLFLLQQPNMNIFSNLEPDDYQLAIRYIRHAILSTDLAYALPIEKRLRNESPKRDFTDDTFVDDCISLLISGSDLSAVCLSWDLTESITASLYVEFFHQGDLEREAGFQPIVMMDRLNNDLPIDQLNFYNFVCLPFYRSLADIFPETRELIATCLMNYGQWELKSMGHKTPVWEPAKSRISKDEANVEDEEQGKDSKKA